MHDGIVAVKFVQLKIRDEDFGSASIVAILKFHRTSNVQKLCAIFKLIIISLFTHLNDEGANIPHDHMNDEGANIRFPHDHEGHGCSLPTYTFYSHILKSVYRLNMDFELTKYLPSNTE